MGLGEIIGVVATEIGRIGSAVGTAVGQAVSDPAVWGQAAVAVARHNDWLPSNSGPRPVAATSLPPAQTQPTFTSSPFPGGVLPGHLDEVANAVGSAMEGDYVGALGDLLGMNGSNGNGAVAPSVNGCPPWRPAKASLRLPPYWTTVNPATGRTHFIGDLGRPLLFTRDLAAIKKGPKLGRKLSRKR